MGEMTVTEAVRRLLAEGLTSGELIAKGYRPGTVYKVQRSMRLAADLAEPTVVRAQGEELEASEEGFSELETGFEDEESAEDRVEALEAELSRVNQALSELRERVEGRLASITSQFSDVWLDLSRIKGQVPQMATEVRWLRETAEDAITLLAPQTIKPSRPWGWLLPPEMALDRTRRRLVEINPKGAQALFGDRIEQVVQAPRIFDSPPTRSRWGERGPG